ncbi:MAG: CBS domain-containing protein [Chloroflexi bacterium]|nr:CBS domain-containing protein [Chloroflexota bacterium]
MAPITPADQVDGFTPNSPMHIILCHENADFDAVASLLAAHKLHPDALPILPQRCNRGVARFLSLYRSGLPLITLDERPSGRLAQVTLVDTQRVPQGVRGVTPTTPIHIIDHHALHIDVDGRTTFTGETIGATTTLLVEAIQAQSLPISTLEATLLALGIYEDTGSLTYGATDPRDLRAAAWLLDQGAVLDTIRRFLEPPLNAEQQALFERLVSTAETRTVEGYTVTVAAARSEAYIEQVNSVAHRLRDTLDPAALFLLVQMSGVIQLVCRATEDAIDVGAVARAFGGGGHERAAAATIYNGGLDQAVAAIWEQVYAIVEPAVRVADLMSLGARTVKASEVINDVVPRLRRIGHEGYPVLDDERVVGLLTRRDADRAVEHGLGDLAVREVMASGVVTLGPNDSVFTLEQRMVESGWGQIPVVDAESRLIGIVTRTDLITHWARVHPTTVPETPPTISGAQIVAVLGKPVADLIDRIAAYAQTAGITLYLVGGVVRDLLLERPNYDIDFVAEGDGIRAAEDLAAQYGGAVHSFRPFGTAKWTLDAAAASALDLELNALPDHIDFATARNEFYEHPTALPTVYNGSIKLDLHRRDFTINTLAVQLSPAVRQGRDLDFYGGLHDLDARLIRVLHSLSFVDDPTRILRAVRFERRLGFELEARTAELIRTALPMLGRITGERLRNELLLLLREQTPEHGLLLLHERGILAAIHPALVIDARIIGRFEAARASQPPWDFDVDPVDLAWHLIGSLIPYDRVPDWCDRLLITHTLRDSIVAAARLIQTGDALADPAQRPSQIDALLNGTPDLALYVVWLVCEAAIARARIREYAGEWRALRPYTDGHTLRQRGLTPGPCFRVILERLRSAWLDGLVGSTADEQRLLDTLLENGVCDDDS